MMKKTMYVLVAGLGLMVSSAACADMTPMPKHDDTQVIVVEGPAIARLRAALNKLDLTDEQKTKIRAIMQNAEPEFDKNVEAAEKNREALHELKGGGYNAAEVARLAEAQGDLVAKTIELRLKVRHDIYELLTPDQRKKADVMVTNMANGVD